ncbi:MAG TPA: T9SS type A sorting domain-containing protein, partial [candidate division Zixibacteria bacterium]|nr:T9SS type A sorting domain-containing protein [candidate division Zixibacteria bacterium]
QNYPNPFNSSTTIRYSLSKRAFVHLKVFNIAGQLVKELVNREQSAGFYRVSWDGTDSMKRFVSSGIYLYCLNIEGEIETKKMTLIR